MKTFKQLLEAERTEVSTEYIGKHAFGKGDTNSEGAKLVHHSDGKISYHKLTPDDNVEIARRDADQKRRVKEAGKAPRPEPKPAEHLQNTTKPAAEPEKSTALADFAKSVARRGSAPAPKKQGLLHRILGR